MVTSADADMDDIPIENDRINSHNGCDKTSCDHKRRQNEIETYGVQNKESSPRGSKYSSFSKGLETVIGSSLLKTF